MRSDARKRLEERNALADCVKPDHLAHHEAAVRELIATARAESWDAGWNAARRGASWESNPDRTRDPS